MNLLGKVKQVADDILLGVIGTIPSQVQNWEYYQTAPWYAKYLLPNKAKVKITPESALEISVFYACVNKIAKSMATMPIEVKIREKDGNVRIDDEHYLTPLLTKSPSSIHDVTAYTFWQTIMKHALQYEAGYARIYKVGGVPVSLDLVHPRYVSPEMDSNGRRYFRVYLEDRNPNKYFDLNEDEMFVVNGLGQGMVGIPISNLAKDALGIAKASEDYQASFFANNLQLGVVLKTPKKLSDEAKDYMRQQWEKQQRGSANAYKISILDNDLDIETIMSKSNDAQLIETRKFQVEEIARFFDMPLHKIQYYEGSKYNNSYEQANAEYVTDTLTPWMIRIQQEVKKKLLQPRSRHYIEFNTWDLIRGDLKTQADFFSNALGGGKNPAYMTVNEVRAMQVFHLNPRDNADVLYNPLNIAGATEANEKQRLENEKLTVEIDKMENDEPASIVEEDIVVENQSEQASQEQQQLSMDGFKKLASHVIERLISKESKFWEAEPSDKEKIKNFYARHLEHALESLTPICETVGYEGDIRETLKQAWKMPKEQGWQVHQKYLIETEIFGGNNESS